MTLDLKNGNKSRKVRCLLDTGGQRSYISEKAANDLCQDVSGLYALECDVCTYIGQDTRSFKRISTGIRINNRLIFIPLLVDSTLNITFEVPGMNEIINKFRQNNIASLDEAFNEDKNHEIVAVDMLIGIDIVSEALFCLCRGTNIYNSFWGVPEFQDTYHSFLYFLTFLSGFFILLVREKHRKTLYRFLLSQK